MIGYHELARAASQNDFWAERVGLPEALASINLDIGGVVQCAEQRALRCVLAITEDEERLALVAEAAEKGSFLKMELTETQKAMMPIAHLALIDGLATGVRAGARGDAWAMDSADRTSR